MIHTQEILSLIMKQVWHNILNKTRPLTLFLILFFASCSKDPEVPQSDNDGTSQYNEHDWNWDDSTKTTYLFSNNA